MSEFTTNVPSPTFGPNGVVVPSDNAILTGVQADINTALGGGVNPQLSTPQGQLATTETAVISDSNALFAWFCNQVDPALNQGRMQDAIARLYFISRIAGTPTIQACTCAGLNNTPIPIGAIAQDENNNLWICQAVGTIVNGSVTLNFASATLGPIPAPTSLTIYQSIYGWESITPTGAATLGSNTESAAQFELRRQNSIALNANQVLDAILGQVLAVAGVISAYVTENVTGSASVVGGVTLNAHSIYVCAIGGTSAEIAQAIWSKKGGGCNYTGNTTITVTDPNPAYLAPAPSYPVTFEIATNVAFAMVVTLLNNTNIPSNAAALIQTAVVNAFAGLDGGSRTTIGSTVFAARYYGNVLALGSWAQLVSIQIGILGNGASFTGSISGTTLTVSGVTGTIAAGQLLQDGGLLLPGTIILSGSGTTWTVNQAQTVAAETMTATTLSNDVTMNINQIAGISAGNVNLLLM